MKKVILPHTNLSALVARFFVRGRISDMNDTATVVIALISAIVAISIALAGTSGRRKADRVILIGVSVVAVAVTAAVVLL
jgi:hypothetical protein